MDLYGFALALGGVGLGAMAATGMGRHSGGSQGGHGGVSHGGASGHAGAGGHAHTMGTAAPGHAGSAGHAQGATPGGGAVRGGAKGSQGGNSLGARSLVALTSPRVLFSICLGFGAVGLALKPVLGAIPLLGGWLLVAGALTGGIAFERLIVTPIWNASLKFASKPALTLESCVSDEATAVTSFDKNGQGIVAIDLDGQVVQVLGTLQSTDREMGIKVHAGERVRIESIDAARNRCTVSLV